MTFASRRSPDHGLAALEQRAFRRRSDYTKHAERSIVARSTVHAAALHIPAKIKQLPRRYILHALVVATLPVALGLTHIYREPAPIPIPPASTPATSDLMLPIAPIALNGVGDEGIDPSAFAEIDALANEASLAEPGFRPDLLQARPVPATIAAESANVRNGPGTNYDKIGEVANGNALTLLSRAGEWYKAQRDDGTIVWVMAELLAVNATAASLLPEATDIPAPPPPKVATVVEANLNLRDGPDTKYVGMTKLEANIQLDLLARYNDWYQVQTGQGQIGWVRSDFLNIAPGVTERIEVVTEIPDPNPALVGVIQEQGVNLRGGPGTDYDKVTKLNSGVQLDLLARYEDWFKVKTSDGKTGWISNELVGVNEYIARRVKTTSVIPALPKPKTAVATNKSKAPTSSRSAPAPASAAGSVVEYAMQFVGSPYVFGASGPNAFDCSGFTRYVYKQYGLNLPHSAEGQYSTAHGSIISNKNELAAGDLVFFVNTYKPGISHVGIYIGNGNVVQAMSPELGLGVANINGAYWSEHYYSAIRPR